MHTLDLYYVPTAAPCRAVVMTAKAVGVELNKIHVDGETGDHLTPQFLRYNPTRTVPTLVDDEFSLWESRAIVLYLAEQYGQSDTLYPKCPKKRALINQRLYFDMNWMYRSFGDYYYPQIFGNMAPDREDFKRIDAAFDFLNTFLEGETYVAGDTLTVADIALLATVSTFEAARYNFREYTDVVRWYENAKRVTPGWDENWRACLQFRRKYFQ